MSKRALGLQRTSSSNHEGSSTTWGQRRGSGLFVTSPDNPAQTCDRSRWRPSLYCFLAITWMKTNLQNLELRMFFLVMKSLLSLEKLACGDKLAVGLPITSSPLRHSAHSYSVSKSLHGFCAKPRVQGWPGGARGIEKHMCKAHRWQLLYWIHGAASEWVQDREGATAREGWLCQTKCLLRPHPLLSDSWASGDEFLLSSSCNFRAFWKERRSVKYGGFQNRLTLKPWDPLP